jgi:hypothetical protein
MSLDDKDANRLWELRDNFLLQLGKQTRDPQPLHIPLVRMINFSILSTIEDEKKLESVLRSQRKALEDLYSPLLRSFPLQTYEEPGTSPLHVHYSRDSYQLIVEWLMDNTKSILSSVHKFSGYMQTELEYETNSELFDGKSDQWVYNFCRFGLFLGVKRKMDLDYVATGAVVGLCTNKRKPGETYKVLQQISQDGVHEPL